MRTFNYFKRLTEEDEKTLKTFDHISAREFDELRKQAQAVFNSQEVKTVDGSKNFDNATAFISGADTLNGFFVCGANLININTNYKLYLIAFKIIKHYDFEKHERKPDTLKAIAIYQDSNENKYTAEQMQMDLRPLADWKKELQRRADDNRNRAEVWQQAKRNYKKDGSPFAILSKNFEGVSVSENYNALKLEIYGRTAKNEYISDTLYNSERFPLNNIDDVIPSIKKYIEYLKANADEYENTLKNADAIYLDVFGAVYEKILKYQSPSNSSGICLEHFYFTVKEIIEKLYIRS